MRLRVDQKQWNIPPIIISVLEAQRTIQLAKKAEIEEKLKQAQKQLEQQLALLRKQNHG